MKLKERLRNIFLNNIGLKLGSLATAVVLWFVITNTSNPTTQRQYSNIPVRFTNTDTITDQGEVITVLDGTDTVSTVTVRAPRSVIDVLESDNIVATADARNLTDDGTIPITFMTNRYYSQVESIKASSYNVKVSVEAEMSKTMQLKAYATGTPEEGYVVGDVTLDQNQIRVSGPQSVVSQISEARANVDVTGATGSITTNVEDHGEYSSGERSGHQRIVHRNPREGIPGKRRGDRVSGDRPDCGEEQYSERYLFHPDSGGCN